MPPPPISEAPPPPPLSTNVIDRINFAIQFEKYRDIILKRWWLIAVCVVGSLLYGAYKAYRQPDIYRAAGSMMVRPRVNVGMGDVVNEELANFYGTQVQLMQSRAVVESARRKLADFEKSLTIDPAPGLQVIQVRNTSIFSLGVTSTSAEFAKRFLDQTMREYISYKKKIRDETTESTASTILREVERLDAERRKAEQELFSFQKKFNVAYFEGQGNFSTQHLVDLKRRLAEATTELELLDAETAEQRLNRLVAPGVAEGARVGDTSTNRSPDNVNMPRGLKAAEDHNTIRSTLTMLKAERTDLGKVLRPKHPKIIRMDEEIDRKQRLLSLAVEQTKEQIAAYRQSLLKQKEQLERSITEAEKQAVEANQKSAEYGQLKSNLNRTTELYDVLLKQLQQIDVGTGIDQEIISINEPATVGGSPVGPNRSRQLMMSGVIGIAIAALIIFLLERFDDRVKTVEELQELVPETVLGQIPKISGRKDDAGPLLMSSLPEHNNFSESFRNVRSSLMFSPMGGQAKTIAITSAIPNDGKTTCSVNLACCLAQVEGGRTLLIDADMRKMNVHHFFGMENGNGLSEALSGQASLDSCVVETHIPNLHLLRAGSSPPNPGELLLSENFRQLLLQMSQYYHRIVIDTPPVLATDDTLSMAPSLDGLIFVVKANQTSLRFVNRSMNLLKQRGAKIFGLVLNQIDTTSAHYYYYYYYSTYYYGRNARQKSGAKPPVEAVAFQENPLR